MPSLTPIDHIIGRAEFSFTNQKFQLYSLCNLFWICRQNKIFYLENISYIEILSTLRL